MSTRRNFLAVLSAGVAGSVAGCLDGIPGGDGGDGGDGGSGGTTATTATTETTTTDGMETTTAEGTETTTTTTTTAPPTNYTIDGVYPAYMGTAGRTGELDPVAHPRRGLTKEWESFVGKPREGPFAPVMAGNRLYAVGGFALTRVNPSGGQQARDWRVEFDTPIQTSATVGGGRAYVATRSGMYAVDVESGETLWHSRDVSTYSGQLTPPIYVNDTLYIVSGGILYALDPRRGRIRWTVGPKGAPGEVALGAGKAFVGSTDGSGGIETYTLDDGSELWAEGLPGGASIYPRYRDGAVYASAKPPQNTPQVFAYTHDGRQLWKRTLKGGLEDSMITAMAVTDGQVLAGDDTGYLHSLAPGDGSYNWRNELGGGKYYQLTVADDRIYAVNDTNFLVTIDAAKGQTIRQKRLPSGTYHPPIVHREAVYVADKRYVYAFS